MHRSGATPCILCHRFAMIFQCVHEGTLIKEVRYLEATNHVFTALTKRALTVWALHAVHA